MNRRYLASFASPEFYQSQRKLNKSALKHGIDIIVPFKRRDIIRTEFYKKNKTILNQPKGSGYWLWKPYIILEILNKVPDNSIVVYSDAGIEICNDLTPLFDICKRQDGILLFSNAGRLNRTWTKRDCFVLMGCDSEDYWNSENILASFHMYVKNHRCVEFVADWLHYCSDERILTDLPNVCGLENLPGFVEHRHDQSVLALLAAKYKIEIFRDPTQWGNHDKIEAFREPNEFLYKEYSLYPYINSSYHTLLNHHRERKHTFTYRVKKRLKAAFNIFGTIL